MANHDNRLPGSGAQNPRVYTGLTASKSPVFFLYPPDIHGRRPSEYTNMQYASPDDRARQEAFRAEQIRQYEEHSRLANAHRGSQVSGQNAQYNASHAPPTPSARSNHRHAEKYYPQQSPPPPRRLFTSIWTCCQNCPDAGPHSSLHTHCLSCNTLKCPNCIEEIVSVQDQAPFQ